MALLKFAITIGLINCNESRIQFKIGGLESFRFSPEALEYPRVITYFLKINRRAPAYSRALSRVREVVLSCKGKIHESGCQKDHRQTDWQAGI